MRLYGLGKKYSECIQNIFKCLYVQIPKFEFISNIFRHPAKMDIEVDWKKDSRNAPKNLQVQIYFSEVIMYFAHEYKGNPSRFFTHILNSVELNGADCPYGLYGIGYTGRRHVVEVEAIACHVGILSMPMTTILITDKYIEIIIFTQKWYLELL
ncbi:hypothetical protein BDA99DRAFT_538987 [Phascolomyces articulosus]|uniref:Uncharacterized protein n=1 Tax=Phascolomyces articulosus TaxID=60185 RepID=A0AAD5K9R3_9FUNG|nr:hypothetical protein BDA99DRAFT_538987 [Phascolomyces articulosus]